MATHWWEFLIVFIKLNRVKRVTAPFTSELDTTNKLSESIWTITLSDPQTSSTWRWLQRRPSKTPPARKLRTWWFIQVLKMVILTIMSARDNGGLKTKPVTVFHFCYIINIIMIRFIIIARHFEKDTLPLFNVNKWILIRETNRTSR